MPNTVHDEKGEQIQSVRIALNIIEMIQANGKTTVTALARELGHSKSTIYNQLRTLEEGELVVHDPDGYRLSLCVLDMANHIKSQVGGYDVITSEVDALADETGEVVQFGMEERGMVSYLYKQAGAQGVESASQLGKKQPMYSTGLGKAILAHLSEGQRRERLQQMDPKKRTPNTRTNERELREDLRTIREQGYAVDDEENFEGIRCVAAPVNNHDTVFGAVSITGPASRITNDRIYDDLAEKATRTANIIELNTKFA